MFDPDQAALLLAQARRARQLRTPLAIPPPTLADGIAAQVARARAVGAIPPPGFKIGATNPAMQAYLGLPGPAASFMAAADLHGDGSTLAYRDFLRPGVECEIAVHLGTDLPPGPCTPDQAAAAVDGVMAGIEVVENRYPDMPAFGTPALVADGVYHAAAVLGLPVPNWRSLDLPALPGTILVDGAVRGEGPGAALAGGPMQALAWLAASAEAAAHGGLRAGQVVMLGSVCLPVWLDGPAHIEVRFPPLPPVTLTLV
ncbi:MAG: 2-keto-4-pentenoate hydratase [Janthinobacterium lividum]